MKINVSSENIKHGLRGSCVSDPVALALKDAGFLSPYVGPNEIRVKDGAGKSAPTPEIVIQFIEKFDNGENCEPFVFEVEL